MSHVRLVTILLTIMACSPCKAQKDSTIQSLQELPVKYINQLDNKIDKYSHRISSKTEKTLVKLSRWENKIHTLIEKADPATAERLFGNNQTTFSTLLQKLQEGKSIAENYTSQYNEYRDKLRTSMCYLQQQKDSIKSKLVKPVTEASQKLIALENNVKNSEVLEQFIKERKRLLIDQCFQYIGKSKYLQKISQENFYYIETLRNYKTLFSDKTKAEETALTILNKIPGFTKFVQENSVLASLFRRPGAATGGGTGNNSLAGLQTSAGVQALIQGRIDAGGPNAQQQIMQNIKQAQGELNKLKDKVLKAGGSSSDAEMPNFKPNLQKTKPFLQRIEFANDISFTKNNNLMPGTANVAFSAAYKFSDTKQLGIGIAYKAGLGSIERIKLTHEGMQLRTFGKIKIKKGLWFAGGWEAVQNAGFKNIEQLKQYEQWQQAALIGVEKKLQVKTKWFKASSISLLWDVLSKTHIPVSQSFQIRYSYNF
jgi:hypothetical protein